MLAKEVVFGLLFILVGLTSADEENRVSAYLPIDIKTKNCGSKHDVLAGKEFIITGTGDFAGRTCSYNFIGQVKENCLGLCYDLKNGSFIKNNETTLTLVTEDHEKVFSYDNVTIGPWCSDDLNISFSLTVPDNYEFDSQDPGYSFSLAIYSKCGDETSMTFEEAIKHLDGYHHGEEFHDKVYKNTIYGIIVGACLAAVFLVILGITLFYYKHHSDRKVSRSASVGVQEGYKDRKRAHRTT